MDENIKIELEMVRRDGGGILQASDVVSFAKRNKTSALHSQFEWNDGEAAEQYRLQQARGIIRATIIVMRAPNGADLPVRAYVALPSDRRGYRAVGQVLDNRDMATEALNGFIRDIDRLRTKYSAFAILAGMLDQVTERAEAEKAKPRSRAGKGRQGANSSR